MLLVCVFNVDKLIFNHIFEIDRLKAKLQKVANKVPIYSVESLKDVEKTEITRKLPVPVSFMYRIKRCYAAALMNLMRE